MLTLFIQLQELEVENQMLKKELERKIQDQKRIVRPHVCFVNKEGCRDYRL